MEEIHQKQPIYNLPDIQQSLENITAIENAYVFEKEMMFAIQRGDADKINELYDYAYGHYPLDHLLKRIPQDPLRQMKNMQVINNTLLRTAAKKGGLPVIYLHILSERFAHIIENAVSYDFLATLSREMGLEYANAVARFSTLRYSDIINEAIRYITSNISKNISLTELAAKLSVNPSYLSRAFKADTGMSLIDYIHHQRIELSKYYFESRSDNITEVAYKVGYNDSSYFAKTFKKITGITPKEYIKNLNMRN